MNGPYVHKIFFVVHYLNTSEKEKKVAYLITDNYLKISFPLLFFE